MTKQTKQIRRVLVVAAGLAVLVLSACDAPAAAPAPATTTTLEQPTPGSPAASAVMTKTEVMTDTQTAVEAKALPAWQKVQLIDARSGKAFTLADFAGKTVYVEPFATWCINCKAQLHNVQKARQQLGDKPVFVTLSVETNLKTEDITQYTNEQGFDWVFAVMTPELLKQLTDEFGLVIATPPSTPHFIIRPNGSTTKLVTGIESVETLVASIQAAGQ